MLGKKISTSIAIAAVLVFLFFIIKFASLSIFSFTKVRYISFIFTSWNNNNCKRMI